MMRLVQFSITACMIVVVVVAGSCSSRSRRRSRSNSSAAAQQRFIETDVGPDKKIVVRPHKYRTPGEKTALKQRLSPSL